MKRIIVLVTVTMFYLVVFGLEDASWSGGGLKPRARFGFSVFELFYGINTTVQA